MELMSMCYQTCAACLILGEIISGGRPSQCCRRSRYGIADSGESANSRCRSIIRNGGTSTLDAGPRKIGLDPLQLNLYIAITILERGWAKVRCGRHLNNRICIYGSRSLPSCRVAPSWDFPISLSGSPTSSSASCTWSSNPETASGLAQSDRSSICFTLNFTAFVSGPIQR